MMAGWVVLGEISFQITFYSHPIHQRLWLPDSISDPEKSHIDLFWTSLENVVIDKPVSCGAVHHYWGGQLGVYHLYESHACCCASLTVKKRAPSSAFIVLARTFLMVVCSTWPCPLIDGCLRGDLLGYLDAMMRYRNTPTLLLASGSERKEVLLWICRIIPLAWYLVMTS